MTALPLYFNNQLVGLDQLTGINYVPGYAELMSLLIAHSQQPFNGYTPFNTFIYPFPGKQTIYAIRGRSWQQGQRLRAYRFGNTADWRTILVHDYDPYTGKMKIEVMASSMYETAELVLTSGYFLTPMFPESMTTTGTLGFAAGGTGGTDIETARQGLQLNSNKMYQNLFADFVLPNSFARYVFDGTDQGPAIATPVSINLDYDFATHPGVYRLTANQAGTSKIGSLQFGKNYDYDWADFAGDETQFEVDLILPALSTSGAYLLEVGLIGAQAKIAFQYKDTLNTGKFQILSGIGGSYTTFNTALTVAAATWYKFLFAISGSNISITVNGANGTTVAKAAFQGVIAANRMTPMVRMTSSGTAVEALCGVDYMWYRKHFAGNGR